MFSIPDDAAIRLSNYSSPCTLKDETKTKLFTDLKEANKLIRLNQC